MRKRNNIFEANPGNEEPNAPKRRGRSNKLLEKRNECLVSRYYYYNHYTDKRYEAIMQHLSDKFFLSPSTIQDLVQDNMERLRQLKEAQPRKGYFGHRWPHLVW
jgi:hypothetical protein